MGHNKDPCRELSRKKLYGRAYTPYDYFFIIAELCIWLPKTSRAIWSGNLVMIKIIAVRILALIWGVIWNAPKSMW